MVNVLRGRDSCLRAALALLTLSTLLKSEAENFSQTRSIHLHATVSTDPAALKLHWPERSDLGRFRLKIIGADGSHRWLELPTGSTSYTDITGGAELAHEYLIASDSTTGGETAYGTLYGGVDVPLTDARGTLILLVDQTQAPFLVDRLQRFQRDLIGDGWQVRRLDVSPAESPTSLKELIRALYDEDPENVNSVLLFGNLAVPYSGQIAPDGHFEDHLGAWPADLYYGEMTETWTDRIANNLAPPWEANRNIPWDGKWDQSIVRGIELAVARIDFANLPGLTKTETELLANYLDKNHAYRRNILSFDQKALIQDRLSFLKEAPGSGVQRAFSSCFGPGATVDGTWNADLLDPTTSYCMAAAFSQGNFTSLSQVTNLSELDTHDYRVGFSFMMSSYSGDWNTEDNIIRASLASGSHTVAAAWGGRPLWALHRLGGGDTLGNALLHTQNDPASIYSYSGFSQGRVHVALMGDPTLRLHQVTPVAHVTVTETEGAPLLSWPAVPASSYHIYRAEDWQSKFTRLTTTPISTTVFLDSDPLAEAVYMLRAVQLEHNASGSYHNASCGTFVEWSAPIAALHTPPTVVRAEALTETFHEGGHATPAFRITRSGNDLSSSLTVTLKIAGVTPGVDVQSLTSSIQIPAGASEVTYKLKGLSNGEFDEDRAAVMILAKSPLYHLEPSSTAAMVRLLDQPFDEWRKARFRSKWSWEGTAGSDADPDDDNMNNLLEYALHCDPNRPDTMEFDVDAGLGFRSEDIVTYLKNPESTDIDITLEMSAEGDTWQTAPLTAINSRKLVIGEQTMDEMRLVIPSGVLRRFYRLQIELDRGNP